MSTYGHKSKTKNYLFAKLIVSVAGVALGYYLLFHLSTQINPLFGNTFHIVFGCSLLALAFLLLLTSLKTRFFVKKKKRKKENQKRFFCTKNN